MKNKLLESDHLQLWITIDAGCPERLEEQALYSFGSHLGQDKKKDYADCLDKRLEDTTVHDWTAMKEVIIAAATETLLQERKPLKCCLIKNGMMRNAKVCAGSSKGV